LNLLEFDAVYIVDMVPRFWMSQASPFSR